MKRQWGIVSAFFLLIILTTSCSEQDSSPTSTPSGAWLIPQEEVFDGGPGKDGIQALLTPPTVTLNVPTLITDDDLVIGVRVGSVVRAYPHIILDWHEIINDDLNGQKFSLTYCPLTGSGICWGRSFDGNLSTFGVSGLLYNTNLIPYDRRTNSNWSQMKLQCVNGELKGKAPEILPIVETSWKTWKAMYPESKVVYTNTGHNKPYGIYPYFDYRTNHEFLLFPVANDDSRLPRKERVLGVIVGSETKAYQIDAFDNGLSVLNESINGSPAVIAGDRNSNIAVAYSRRLSDGTVLSFTAVEDALPVIMLDNEGTKWDIFGHGTDGPRAGEQLRSMRSYIAYWFAWGAFHPNAALYTGQ